MSEFSIGETLVSGFALVVRRPLAVLCWGLVSVLILALPLAMVLGTLFSALPDLARHAVADAPDNVTGSAFLHVVGSVILAIPLMLLAGLAVQGLLAGAVYRSVLEPQKTSFSSMRFGAQELWLIVMAIARGFVMWVIGGLIIGAAALLCIVGLLIGAPLPQPWAGIVRAPFIVAALVGSVGAFVWIWLRLSLAGPMTFAERQFRLFESWTLTRGHTKELVGLGGLLYVIRLGLPVIIILPIYGAAFLMLGLTMGFMDLGHPGAYSGPHGEADLAPILTAIAPVVIVVVIVLMMALGAFHAIFLAPWAVLYKHLASKAKSDHPAVF